MPAKRKPKKPLRPRRVAPRARAARVLSKDKLLHELLVHSEELKTQNEQLLIAQRDLERARDTYAGLYDYAPIGYVTLDLHGLILEINLTAAALLQRSRGFLLNMPLPALLAETDRDALRAFLQAAFAGAAGRGHEVDVSMREPVVRTFRLLARSPGTTRHSLFTAMFDVTEESRLVRERQAVLTREQARAEQLAAEVAERMRAEEEVKALLQRLVTVQEEERRAIARNLHDHLGQQLTALRLTVTTLRSPRRQGDGLNARLDAIDEILSKIDRDLDHLAWDLRPAVLDGAGLSAALEEFLGQWSSTTGIPAELHETGPTKIRLAHNVELHLYRIVQEALNNIVKHAGAKHVNVLFERRGEDLNVIVEDDGKGFDADTARSSRDRHTGMGLISMRERAALVGGSLQVETAPGKGTTVFVRINSAPPRASR